MDGLLQELQDRFGHREGLRIFNVIMPGIMGDFNRMLKKAAAGSPVFEEYRLEDGSGVIRMKGTRGADGKVSVEGHLVK